MIFYFILGILFIDCLLPIIENITGCICTRLEQYKAKCAVKINEYNEQMANSHNCATEVVGFQHTLENEFEEEFDD